MADFTWQDESSDDFWNWLGTNQGVEFKVGGFDFQGNPDYQAAVGGDKAARRRLLDAMDKTASPFGHSLSYQMNELYSHDVSGGKWKVGTPSALNPASNVDTAKAEADRKRQQDLISKLTTEAKTGEGPWQQQLTQATQAGEAGAEAIGQSQPGVGYQSALRNIQNAQGATQQMSANEGAYLKAQQQLSAEQQLAQLTGNVSSQDLTQAQAQADAAAANREQALTLQQQQNQGIGNFLSAYGQGKAAWKGGEIQKFDTGGTPLPMGNLTADSTQQNSVADLLSQLAKGQGPSLAPSEFQRQSDENIMGAMRAGAETRNPANLSSIVSALGGASGAGAAAVAGERAKEQTFGQDLAGGQMTDMRAHDLATAKAAHDVAFRNRLIDLRISLTNQQLLRGLLSAGSQGLTKLSSLGGSQISDWLNSGEGGTGPGGNLPGALGENPKGDAEEGQYDWRDFPTSSAPGDWRSASTSYASAGGPVFGQEKKPGNSPSNDNVPALLSAGEYVVDKESLQVPWVRQAVNAIKAMKGEKMYKGGTAFADAVKRRHLSSGSGKRAVA